MTEAKELDPAALEATVDYVLQYGGRCRGCADEAGICPHSGLACDPDDAAKVIRYVLRAAEYGRSNGYIEALSTAPVALEVKPLEWETDEFRSMHVASSVLGVYSAWEISGTGVWARPDARAGTLCGSTLEEAKAAAQADYAARIRSAIHPAPSREAVIDRAAIIEECARVVEAMPMYVDRDAGIGPAGRSRKPATFDDAAAALRSLPSNAPSLGEARLAEGEAVAWQWSDFSGKWYTVDTARSSVAEQEELARLVAAKYEGRVRPLYAHPSHVQAEAGEAVAPTTPKISELANDLWEALFGIMRGAVPDDLTNEVLIQLATRMAEAYSISERAAP